MRTEFSKSTKEAAYARSGGICEAAGPAYGRPEGQRCCNDLKRFGVHFDHSVPEALSHDASLDNCLAVCPPCHRYKTDKIDKPQIAKADRQRDSHLGISGPKRKIPSRPFRRSS